MSRRPHPPLTSVTRSVAALAALTLVVGVAAAPSAAAEPRRPASAPVVAAANGTVGLAQPVTVVAPALKGQSVTVQFSLNGTPVGQQGLALNAQGGGSFPWTPPAAGSWSISGVGSLAAVAAIPVTVAAIPTHTILSAVNFAQPGTPTTMTVTVEATGGNYVPQGTVTISNGFGGAYGTVPLWGQGSGLASGSFAWTPPSIGTYPIIATYTPSAGIGGSPNATGSTSTASVAVMGSVPLVTLRLPAVFTIGEPATVTAIISNPLLTGTAAFLNNINGVVTGMSGSIPVVSQAASTSWTPGTLGNQFIIADFSATNTTVSGSSSQAISVQPAGAPDGMSVQAAGLGVLHVNTPESVKGGQRIAITAASGSGATVNLSEGGPCLLQGATLVTPKAGGTCVLTASSPGAGAFSANTAAFVITVARAK
jgi:hypothetical protein